MSVKTKVAAVTFLSLVWGCSLNHEATEPAGADSAEAALIAHYQALAPDDPTAEVQYLLLQFWLREEYDRALPRLMEMAEAGQPMAALLVSSAYTHGLGVTADAELAAAWKTRAIQATEDEGVLAFLEADEPG